MNDSLLAFHQTIQARRYRDMSEAELLAAMGTDRCKWAEAFIDCYPSCKCDVNVLAAWFANAMMARTRR